MSWFTLAVAPSAIPPLPGPSSTPCATWSARGRSGLPGTWKRDAGSRGAAAIEAHGRPRTARCDGPALSAGGDAARRRQAPAAWHSAQRRSAALYALPSDLTGSLHHLDDGQIDRLLRAVAGEARRRRRPVAEEGAPPPPAGSGSRRGRRHRLGQREEAAAAGPAGSGEAHPRRVRGGREAGSHRPAAAALSPAGGARRRQAEARQGLSDATGRGLRPRHRQRVQRRRGTVAAGPGRAKTGHRASVAVVEGAHARCHPLPVDDGASGMSA